MTRSSPFDFAATLLAWYDRHRRVMPWRARPGETPDPYAVWLSEIMLQQTTVAAVKPYFLKFLARWPTVHDLAAAATEDVMAAWAGLGYYARARNLHACAKTVSADHGGVFPDTEAALMKLPGIGPYTAAAITAIAFGRRAVVVDGNVERVMARLHAVAEPLPGAKAKLRALADEITPNERPGDYAQGVMDLGATICTPKSPACVLCPWSGPCLGRKQGLQATLPRKSETKATPTRHGVAFWLEDAQGRVLLHRRPPKGLLGGMLAFPSTAWRDMPWTDVDAGKAAPQKATWTQVPGVVEHTFTHFHLKLQVWIAQASKVRTCAENPVWVNAADVAAQGLPNVMQKVVQHVVRNHLQSRHVQVKTARPKSPRRKTSQTAAPRKKKISKKKIRKKTIKRTR